MRPFLRWAGGKRWLADTLAPRITAAISPSGRYFEPFLGAGAIALALAEPDKLGRQTFLLNDWSVPLINAWTWLIRSPQAVHRELQLLAKSGSDAEAYGRVRSAYNAERGQLARAAMFLYLNATSFNGVYRENLEGHYNVPHGRTVREFMDLEAMIAVRDLLDSRSKITQGDFEGAVDSARAGDVIYADPPYDGVFGDYTARGFTVEDQTRLAGALYRAAGRGAVVFTSNADTVLIRSLYDWAKIESVSEPRGVAARASARVKTSCLLIEGRSR